MRRSDAIVLVIFAGVTAFTAGIVAIYPLRSWLPPCEDISFGFCRR